MDQWRLIWISHRCVFSKSAAVLRLLVFVGVLALGGTFCRIPKGKPCGSPELSRLNKTSFFHWLGITLTDTYVYIYERERELAPSSVTFHCSMFLGLLNTSDCLLKSKTQNFTCSCRGKIGDSRNRSHATNQCASLNSCNFNRLPTGDLWVPKGQPVLNNMCIYVCMYVRNKHDQLSGRFV